MFEKDIVPFYIGAAVGVTVGLCAGKFLFSNTSSKYIVIQNKMHSNTSNVETGSTGSDSLSGRRSIDKTLKYDNVSINKKYKNRLHLKNAVRYSVINLQNSTSPTPSLVKSKKALSDSKINFIDTIHIDETRAMKEAKLYETIIPSYGSFMDLILDKEKSLSQNTVYFIPDEFNNAEEKILNDKIVLAQENNTISRVNSMLKLDLPNANKKKIKDIPACTSIEYSSNNSSNENSSVGNDSNVALCNTFVGVGRANLYTTVNYELSDIDEFNELMSSSKHETSSPF